MAPKRTVAIYLRDELRGKQLAEAIGSSSIRVLSISSSEELYNVLNTELIDCLIMENNLRGFLSGLDILERVFQDLLRPVTILLAIPTQETRDRLQSLGSVSLVIPATSNIELQRLVTELLAKAKNAVVAIPLEARRIVKDFEHIRPLPQLLFSLMEKMEDPNVDTADLAHDISMDPKATSNLLKLANSSVMGFRRRIENVFDAVTLLGVRQTTSLILFSTVVEAQNRIGSIIPPKDHMWYNRRALMIANCSQQIAEQHQSVSPNTAHLLGLLQDVGILVMASAYGTGYSQLLNRARSIGNLRLEFLEQSEYGITHADVSAAVLNKWDMAPPIISVISRHHQNLQGMLLPESERWLLFGMAVGEAFANLTDGHLAHRYPVLTRLIDGHAGANAQSCKNALSLAVAKTEEDIKLFRLPVPQEEELFAKLKEAAALNLPDFGPDTSAPELDTGIETTSNAKPAQPAAIRIVAVDDEPLVLEIIARYLEPKGYEVIRCKSADEAIAMASGAAVMLLDMHLRNTKGSMIAKLLRDAGYKGPIIMVTGDRSRKTVADCIAAGATGYITKPIQEDLLLSKIREQIVSR